MQYPMGVFIYMDNMHIIYKEILPEMKNILFINLFFFLVGYLVHSVTRFTDLHILSIKSRHMFSR